MNYKMMGRFIAQILSIEGLFMVPALLIGLFCGESAAVQGFLFSMALIALLSTFLYLLCRKAPNAFYAKEIGRAHV